MLKKSKFRGKLFIMAAPSGAGKTSVVKGVIDFLKPLIPIEKVITFTTRKPRANEVPGQDYIFTTIQNFINLKKENFFMETTEYDGNYYGSPASIIPDLKSGKSLIMITDCAGAKNFKNNILSDVVTIWLTVPSLEILRKRLEQRNSEDKESFNVRLKLAQKEIEQESTEHFFQYHVLNDDLETTIKTVVNIIQKELEI